MKLKNLSRQDVLNWYHRKQYYTTEWLLSSMTREEQSILMKLYLQRHVKNMNIEDFDYRWSRRILRLYLQDKEKRPQIERLIVAMIKMRDPRINN